MSSLFLILVFVFQGSSIRDFVLSIVALINFKDFHIQLAQSVPSLVFQRFIALTVQFFDR
jgi:hypothetical protein